MRIVKAEYLAPRLNASGNHECFVYLEDRPRRPIELAGADEIRDFLHLHGVKKVSELKGKELNADLEGVLA